MFGFFRSKPYKDLSVDEFREKWQSAKDAILIDARTDAEIAEGKLPGAIQINIMDPSFMQKVRKLDKNKPCFIYCRSGGRSGRLADIMCQLGFKEVYNMQGGIIAWENRYPELVE